MAFQTRNPSPACRVRPAQADLSSELVIRPGEASTPWGWQFGEEQSVSPDRCSFERSTPSGSGTGEEEIPPQAEIEKATAVNQ